MRFAAEERDSTDGTVCREQSKYSAHNVERGMREGGCIRSHQPIAIG